MRRGWIAFGTLALTGCIPQVAPPDAGPPPERVDAPGDPQWQPPADPGPTPPDRPDERGVEAPPTAPPAWRALPAVPDARVVAEGTYRVRRGDTLRAIGEETGAGAEAIARANDLAPPYAVVAGRVLTIPGGRYHRVHAGETGIAIARAYGVDWSRIVTANALAEPYLLRAGQRILIPGDAPGRSAAAERAAAFTLDIDDLLTGSQPAIAESARPPAASPSPRRILPATTPIAPPASLRGGFAWPVAGRLVGRFGPTGASGERYNGVEIAVPLDTPVRAAADGVVAYAGSEVASLGGLVIIRHGSGWTTVYGHCAKLLVQRGQAVKRGQVIARSGDTGEADRPQLHFELRKGRTPVDPQTQLGPL